MKSKPVEATFRHVIYSPKGEIEGALLDDGGSPVQITSDKHDEALASALMSIEPGQMVSIQASPQAPSARGESDHPVYAFERLVAIDGSKPAKPNTGSGAAYRGKIVRFNYAKHGAANGVVLDTGDFIHTKPEGMVRLKLKVGDHVEADGDAHRLATDGGWAVEATHVNGKAVKVA